jgi:four helix bundle protein
MNTMAEALKKRTHDFFVRVIRLCGMLPGNASASNISEQLLRSSGSVDSNYGAACKSRTRKLFVDKVGIAAEEADESKRWLEALHDADLGERQEVGSLVREANELTAILVASHKTAKARLEEAERRAAAARAARRNRQSSTR